MKFRIFTLTNGTKIFLGKNAKNNDELVKLYKGKENIILHTVAPGSPFCVIEKINPTKEEIQESAIICAAKSQDWRDNQQNVQLHRFTGKDIKKPFWLKEGTWKLTSKPKVITIKKLEIKNWEKKNV